VGGGLSDLDGEGELVVAEDFFAFELGVGSRLHNGELGFEALPKQEVFGREAEGFTQFFGNREEGLVGR
jgi:hypothetical protein